MSSHLSAERALALTSELVTVSESLFVLAGRWAMSGDTPAVCVSMATLSRHLGEHAVWWKQVRPESVLLVGDSGSDRRSDGDLAGADPRASLGRSGLIEPPADDDLQTAKLAWLTDHALPRLRAVVAEIGAGDGPDGAPFRRVARWVEIDLETALGGR